MPTIHKKDDPLLFESLLHRFLTGKWHFELYIKSMSVGADENGAFVKYVTHEEIIKHKLICDVLGIEYKE